MEDAGPVWAGLAGGGMLGECWASVGRLGLVVRRSAGGGMLGQSLPLLPGADESTPAASLKVVDRLLC